ncbi:SDR family NAD(P)-dependent oxidoreductase [Catenovulum maritimum]|uniref:Dihydromonapterin reductase n=1 Tax=Catenovulum maritimum TaxID=1513271 RepID=A0A0J8GZD5_9ALTE|nr:SDR family oxidoreductase [Catenovulum maritimum]KMT66594.1 hypothetical protein XM47_03420 [Catenovulum maritimum]
MADKWVLVTGATGLIGKAICNKLAKSGYAIVVHFHKQQELAQQLVAGIESVGLSAVAVYADLTQSASVQNLFEELKCKQIQLVGLVNNAGADCGRFSVFESDSALIEQAMKVNFYSAVDCIQLAITHMKEKGGSIVNVTSYAIETGGYRLAHYVAAKSALAAYSKSIARELAEFNIRVNNVSPAMVVSSNESNQYINSDRFPMGRPCFSSEVAESVLWLLSEQSSYVSGTNLSLSGAR